MNGKQTGVITSSNSEARTSTGSAGGWGAEGTIPDADPLPFFSPFELFARALPFWTAEELEFVAPFFHIPTAR